MELQKLISYASVNGGVNNLQIVKVYRPTSYRGIIDIIKTFTSKKHLAITRADKYIKHYGI